MKKLLSTLLAGCLSLIGASAAVGPGSGTNRLYISYTAGNNANYIEVAADNALGQARISSGLAGATKPLRPLVLSGNGTTLMLIVNTNGNIGISTNNPQERLHVHGNILVASNAAVLGTASVGSNYVAGGSKTDGIATFVSDANIGGAANVTGDITTYANGSVLGTLGVGDTATFSNDVNVAGTISGDGSGLTNLPATGSAQTNNLNVGSTNVGNVSLIVTAPTNHTTNIFQTELSSGEVTACVDSNGDFQTYSADLTAGFIELFASNAVNRLIITTPSNLDYDIPFLILPELLPTNGHVLTYQDGLWTNQPVSVEAGTNMYVESSGNIFTVNSTISSDVLSYQINSTNYPYYSTSTNALWTYALQESNTVTFEIRVTLAASTNYGSWKLNGTARRGGTGTNVLSVISTNAASTTGYWPYLAVDGTNVILYGAGASLETNRWVAKGFYDVVENAQWAPPPFTPDQVSGYFAHWTGDDTPAYADGSLISNWVDIAGSSIPLTNSWNPGNVPVLSNTFLNGHDILYFTGDYLGSDSATLTDPLCGTDVPYTVVAVFSETTAQSDDLYSFSTNAGSVYSRVISTPPMARYYSVGSGSPGNITGSIPITTNGWHVGIFRDEGVTFSSWIDGTNDLESAANAAGDQTINRFYIGCDRINDSLDNTWDGAIAEFIFYTNAITGNDVTNLWNYLNAKYSLYP